MTEFASNNMTNISIGLTFFEYSYDFQPQVLYKIDINPHSESKVVNKLAMELKNLVFMYIKNLQHIKEL